MLKQSKKLRDISADRVEALIEALMWFWGTLHQNWRFAVEDKYGLEAALKLELKFVGKVGKSHAKRIKTIFETGTGISGFVRAFRFAPENFVENFEILEHTDQPIIIYNPSCSVQKARIRKGKGEFSCKASAIVYFTNFCREIDSNIKLSCLVCPPDNHPDDCFCKWRLDVM